MDRPRRPATGARSALRRSERVRGRARRAVVEASAAGPSVGLTTRAAALGLVLCALVISAALPLRGYLAQRGQIAELAQSQTAQRVRVAELQQERTLLDDPTHIAALARERLHFVKPGETSYVVIGPRAAAVPPTAGGPVLPAGPDSPWWSQLWGSVRTADALPR